MHNRSRRSFLTLIGTTALGGCVQAFTNKPSQSPKLTQLTGAWRMYRSDAAHTATVPSTAPTKAITPVWTKKFDLPLNSQPILLNNTIYTATPNGKIYALEAHTGEEKWTQTLDETGVDHSPAITDNRLLLSTTTDVIAYDHNESFQWRIPLEGTPIAPTIYDSAGYVVTTEIGSLTQFNPQDGTTNWTRPITPTEYAPTVDDTRVYTAELSGDVFARNTSDGMKTWHCILPEMPSTTVVLSDGRAYVGTHAGHLVALDAKTGEQKWVHQVKSHASLFAPVVTSDRVYSVDLHGTVYAFTHNGDQRWTYDMKGKSTSNVVNLSPTRSGNILFTLGPNGTIYAFDIATPRKQPNSVATVQLADLTATPIIVDGVLFAPGSELKALTGTND